jgi:hypothetical protein
MVKLMECSAMILGDLAEKRLEIESVLLLNVDKFSHFTQGRGCVFLLTLLRDIFFITVE